MIGDRLSHPGLNLGASDAVVHEDAQSPLFGFWIFLMSDAVIFALLFATYATMMHATAGGPGARELFGLGRTFVETLVLLVSSFTFGMASLALKYRPDARWMLIASLLATLLLGFAFLGLELGDFRSMASRGAVPQRSGFLSAFFTLVGTHGLHVASGCVWIVIMIVQLLVFGAEAPVKTRIMRLGLFWHFLDIVWIAIFSVVYLRGLL